MSSQTKSQGVEDVRDNIVKIVDSKGNFYGTGFIIEVRGDKYCITCHHCICRLNETYIERSEIKCSVEWMEELSDMSKDIAILKVKDCDNIKPLNYAKEAMSRLDVFVWGFSAKELETFPQGSPRENGILSNTSFLFSWPEEKIVGAQQNWNRKPKVSIFVFQFDGKFDIGFSGAPVCYSHGNNIVGVFTAKDDSRGFVIPIQTLLEKFEGEQKVAYPSPTVDMSYYVEKGNKSLIKGDYFEAIEQYEIVLNDPNYINALNNKGLSLGRLGKYKEAIEYFDKALAINTKYLLALNNKGLYLYRLGKYKQAIEYYDKALAINTKHVSALSNKGSALNDSGKYKEAIKWIDKALAIDPNHVDALVSKGYSLDKLGKYKEAIEYYDKASTIDPNPDDVEALVRKGVVLSGKLGKYKEAIEYYDKALAINTKHVSALTNKGIALGELRKYKQAIEYYDKAIKYYDKALGIERNYIINLNNKGLALTALGKHKKAIAWLDKALDIEPNFIHALNNKGLVFRLIGKYKQAIECYDKALAIEPKFTPALGSKGLALFYLKKYKQAIKYYDKALAINSRDADVLTAKARAVAMLKEYAEAIRYYDKALAINPDHVEALNGKSDALNLVKKNKTISHALNNQSS